MLMTLLIVILILWLISAIPNSPINSGIGLGGNGLIGTVLIVILILVLLGHINI